MADTLIALNEKEPALADEKPAKPDERVYSAPRKYLSFFIIIISFFL